MKAKETFLQPIFEGTKQYIIPLFQRTYSWKFSHWKTLWDDLYSLYIVEDKRKHFFGALVSMPVDMTPAGVNKYLLIDGQQRITTVFLILAVIRDIALESDDRILADQINELYLINKWADSTNIYKLFPSHTDRLQFESIINRKGDLDFDNNVVKAYQFYRNKFEANDSNGNNIDLKRMLNTIMQDIIVVDIVLDKEENPYLIFESLNAKGEPLTQADLVRNYILMRITNSEDQEVAYRDFWLPMQKELDSEITNFIWRYLIKDSNSAKITRLDEIYEDIKYRLTDSSSSKVVDFLMDMHTFSGYYLCLINPDKFEPNIKIRQLLKRLNRWDIKTTYPFLLNIYHDYKNIDITDTIFCEILEVIESFVIRRAFCRIPTNALNKIFISLYKNIDLLNIINSLSNELIKHDWPSDNSFKNAWTYFPIYQSGQSKCRLILESIENKMTRNNEPVDLTNASISIEHIMPQTLNEDWELLLGNKTAEVYETFLHTIGNLTLTGSNSDLGNDPLLEKRKIYLKSNFALNKDLSEIIIWNEYTIRKRALSLFTIASEIWKHPGEKILTSDEIAENKQDPTGKKPTGFLLFGSEYHVDSWREMLLTVLRELALKHNDHFTKKAIQVKTNRRVHISRQPDNMNTPIKIQGTDLWVEANQSSRSVLWVIYQTLTVLGEPTEEFEAYW